MQIEGIGWVTPRGIGPDHASTALILGSGDLPPLKSRALLGEVHKRFGRFDDYTKAGFGALALALLNADLDQWDSKRPIGLVVSTERGCLALDTAYFETAATDDGALASPNLFAYTLPSTMLGEAAIQFGLTGPSFVVDDTVPGHLAGIHMAADLLLWEMCDTVVAGWCDVAYQDRDIQNNDCGAVFVVLSRHDEVHASLRWEENALWLERKRMESLEQLVNNAYPAQPHRQPGI